MNSPESELARHRARLEIVEGLTRALDAGGQILDVVHASTDRAEARTTLMTPPWGFTEMVASHILDTPYGRHTKQSRASLAQELIELRETIERLL